MMEHYKKLVRWLESIVNIPYWLAHGLVALLISLLFLAFDPFNTFSSCFMGAMFYIGRELRDWEKLGWFDWKGFIPPILMCVLLYTIVF